MWKLKVCFYVLLSWSAKVKSPSYRPSLKAIPHTEIKSFRAGMLAPPVSGIHHCLEAEDHTTIIKLRQEKKNPPWLWEG